MVITVSVEAAAKFQVDYAIPSPQPPHDGLSELTWIRDQFGYGNADVIIDVRDPKSFLWALAYNGGLLYYGNLFYLLANQTDYSLLNSPDSTVRSDYVGAVQRLWVYGALRNIDSGKYLILVPSGIYEPDALEMQALTPIGGGVLGVIHLDNSRIHQLLASWNYARSSNNLLGATAPYLSIHPLADCSMYSHWTSTSSSLLATLARNITDVSTCSVHVQVQTFQESSLYTTLTPAKPWNLMNESYIGFYFKGTTNTTGYHSLMVMLSTASEYTSYSYYAITDRGLWDGTLHGLLIPLSGFQATGTPVLSSIVNLRLGVYTSQAAIFDFNIQYVATAHIK